MHIYIHYFKHKSSDLSSIFNKESGIKYSSLQQDFKSSQQDFKSDKAMWISRQALLTIGK